MHSPTDTIAQQKGFAVPFPFHSKTTAELVEFINGCNLHDKRMLVELLSRDIAVYLDASSTFHGSDEILDVCINGSVIQICIDETQRDYAIHQDYLADRDAARAIPNDEFI
jgi:hypothetical protein